MLSYIPEKISTVLDVGCANGKFASMLKKRQSCRIWGVENNAKAANAASTCIDCIIIKPIEDALDELPEKYFDCIILNDILEHLTDPNKTLLRIKRHMVENGIIVYSIPNVRYFPVLFDLLIKRDWKYEKCGVLDNTHLRFFTKKSIIRMFEINGFCVQVIDGIKPCKNLILSLINIITFNYFHDARYLQFVGVASLISQGNVQIAKSLVS